MAMMKKFLLTICCTLVLGMLYAQLPPPPEMYIGPRLNSFSVGEQDERYESTLQKLPSIGLAGGVHFPAAHRLNLPIYMGIEASILRQNVFHVFTGESLVRTADYRFQQLNLVVPVKFYFLNRDKDPLKVYVQGGLSFQLLNYAAGYTETIAQVEIEPGVFKEQTELKTLDRKVNAFRFTSVPVEGGLIFYPGKGPYGFGLSGGLFLTELTTKSSGLGYTNAWVSASFNMRFTGSGNFGF